MAHINMARIKAKTAFALAALLCHLSFMACQPNSASSTGDDDTKLPAEDLEQPTGVGEGTAQKPYTVGQVLAGTDKTTDVWVAGYIVGYAVNTINKSYFSATGAGTDNVLLAATPDETGINRLLTVQLSGKSVQQGVSLAYNPKNLKQAVMLHTALISRYLYAPGLREVDAYLWLTNPGGLDLNSGWKEAEEQEEPEEPGEPETPDNPTDTPEDQTQQHGECYGDNAMKDVDVLGLNQQNGFSENYPCTPRYIQQHSLLEKFLQASGYMIGYVRWYDEDSTIVAITTEKDEELTPQYTFYLELTESEILTWMRSTFTEQKRDWMLRINARLKQRSQRIYINKVESLDWIYFNTPPTQ